MKVILINPAFNRYGGVKGLGGTLTPLNLCCLAAYVRQQHPDVEFRVLDSEIREISHEETVEETAGFLSIRIFLRRLYYNMPVAMRKYLSPVVDKYLTKKFESNG